MNSSHDPFHRFSNANFLIKVAAQFVMPTLMKKENIKISDSVAQAISELNPTQE